MRDYVSHRYYRLSNESCAWHFQANIDNTFRNLFLEMIYLFLDFLKFLLVSKSTLI